MLSNAYFLAKFRFDTAENEPAKNLQNFAKFERASLKPAALRDLVAGMLQRDVPRAYLDAEVHVRGAEVLAHLLHDARITLDRANFRGLVLGCIEAKFCK